MSDEARDGHDVALLDPSCADRTRATTWPIGLHDAARARNGERVGLPKHGYHKSYLPTTTRIHRSHLHEKSSCPDAKPHRLMLSEALYSRGIDLSSENFLDAIFFALYRIGWFDRISKRSLARIIHERFVAKLLSRVARPARGAVRIRCVLVQYVEGPRGESAGRRHVVAADQRLQQKCS